MKFLGTGSALPKKVVSNDDLAQVMDTSDEWIRSRTGIGMRHIAVEETTTSMAVEAAEKALADAKISGCEIDLIIAGTISPDFHFNLIICHRTGRNPESCRAVRTNRKILKFHRLYLGSTAAWKLL